MGQTMNYIQAVPEYELHDKDFYLQLAEEYNIQAASGRKTKYDLERAYKSLTNETWPYKDTFSEKYSAFIYEYLNAINEAGIKLRRPVNSPEKWVKNLIVFPCKAPQIREIGAESLKDLIPKNGTQIAYNGVGVKGEWVYATNGFILIKIWDQRWAAYDGRILPYDQLEKIQAGFIPYFVLADQPHYEMGIPVRVDRTIVWKWNINEITDLMFGAYRSMRMLKTKLAAIGLQFTADSTASYFQPSYIYHALNILRANGATHINLEFNGDTRPLLLRADNGNLSAIMPIDLKSKSSLLTVGTVTWPITSN